MTEDYKYIDKGGFTDYQLFARETAIYPEQGGLEGLLYTILGLAGEAGELCNKVKKVLRDDGGLVTAERYEQIRGEVGDCLWYLANICEEMNMNLGDIAVENLTKLYSRKERGVLGGGGDAR